MWCVGGGVQTLLAAGRRGAVCTGARRIERRGALRSANWTVSGRVGRGVVPVVPPEARVCWLACHARDTETHAYPSEVQLCVHHSEHPV
jgi:hypothetical protein